MLVRSALIAKALAKAQPSNMIESGSPLHIALRSNRRSPSSQVRSSTNQPAVTHQSGRAAMSQPRTVFSAVAWDGECASYGLNCVNCPTHGLRHGVGASSPPGRRTISDHSAKQPR